MKLEEKLREQQQQAEAPLLKDICSWCGGEQCECNSNAVENGRWNWYGEKDE